MARIDPERAAALYAETKSVVAVAAYIGASASGVWNALKRAGVAVQSHSERMKALNADPEFKARNAAAASKRMKALHADPEFKARLKAGIQRRHFGVEVPAWVPNDLRDDYIDVARLSGEDAAASHVRRLKREAAL